VDQEEDRNVLSFSLENFLDVRKEDREGYISYAQWATFNLIQGYDLHEARRDESAGDERQPFEPLTGTMTLMPFPNLDFDAEVRWDHYENDITFADLSLDFTVERSEGRKDEYELEYQFVEGESENLGYHVDVNLLYGFSVGASLKRELNLRHNIQSAYWLDYETQCWALRFAAERLEGIDSIMLSFRLLGMGDTWN
jgi:hypothetical protein